MNELPFLYDNLWHMHEESYNKFYDINLIANETIKNENLIFPIMIYESSIDKKRFVSLGSFNSVSPLFLRNSNYDSSSFKKLFKKYLILSKEITAEYNIDKWLIHQFPLQTFNRPFPMYEEYGYKTYNRGRSFIDLQYNDIKEIKMSIRTGIKT